MKSIITNGFLISKTKFNDNTNIINLYTEDLGKISCSVVGTTKINSKMNSHLQYGKLLKCYLVKTKNHFRVANLEVVKSFDLFYSNYNNSVYLFTLLEIINKIYETEYEDRRIFLFFIMSFDFFENSSLTELTKLSCIFIKIISLNGLYGSYFFDTLNIPNYQQAITNARSTKYMDITKELVNFEDEKFIFNKLLKFIEDEFEINIKSTQALIG